MPSSTDIYTPEKRSEVMGRVKSRNTAPELSVRSMLHKMGFRFRVNVARLPGTPDVVLPRHKKVIFVHGCFWHQHGGCKRATIPKTRSEWWQNKLRQNVERDEVAEQRLRELGWSILVVWQCQIRDTANLSETLRTFLEDQS